MNELLSILLTAGGAAFLAAIVNGVKSLRSSKNESEESLIKRINEDAEQAHQDADKQRERAIRAEKMADKLRDERNEALEELAKIKRILIDNQIDYP